MTRVAVLCLEFSRRKIAAAGSRVLEQGGRSERGRFLQYRRGLMFRQLKTAPARPCLGSPQKRRSSERALFQRVLGCLKTEVVLGSGTAGNLDLWRPLGRFGEARNVLWYSI